MAVDGSFVVHFQEGRRQIVRASICKRRNARTVLCMQLLLIIVPTYMRRMSQDLFRRTSSQKACLPMQALPYEHTCTQTSSIPHTMGDIVHNSIAHNGSVLAAGIGTQVDYDESGGEGNSVREREKCMVLRDERNAWSPLGLRDLVSCAPTGHTCVRNTILVYNIIGCGGVVFCQHKMLPF